MLINKNFRASLWHICAPQSEWLIDAYTLPIVTLLLATATMGDRIDLRRFSASTWRSFTVSSPRIRRRLSIMRRGGATGHRHRNTVRYRDADPRARLLNTKARSKTIETFGTTLTRRPWSSSYSAASSSTTSTGRGSSQSTCPSRYWRLLSFASHCPSRARSRRDAQTGSKRCCSPWPSQSSSSSSCVDSQRNGFLWLS